MRPSITPTSTGGASGACDSLALRTIRSIALPSSVAAMLARRMGARNPYKVRGSTFQMSEAYSRIARSEENQPTRAVFSTLERHQAR